MGRLIAFAAVLFLLATASVRLAAIIKQLHRDEIWKSGEITGIERGPEYSLVTLNRHDGQTYEFTSTNEKLKGIKTGNKIAVKDIKGWAVYIESTDTKKAKSSPELRQK